ncbi:hypothetical protein N7539_009514 [Penicillium diatomitis]|uniref:Uncharacterized protein n=1 Tax=Penicillium diatomitis TaxID=2819901 RepID=A0A9X0BJ06_9EURO|nr:uncharacterized protein N7539_009514 [Penicillium diatomitis]KAJ5466558.1 hypothetical protein N7539_009514 [Penicillium diatomitis]
MATQGSYTQYASSQSQHATPLSALPAPSPAPTPPPSNSQRSGYPAVFAQHGVPSGARDLGPQSSSYRPPSPASRPSNAAFGTRTEPVTTTQSSNSPFALGPRQMVQQHSFASTASPTPGNTPQHSQSYQQHVQTLVNGAHQPHRSTPVSMAGGPSQYGHAPLTPQVSGRAMPSLASLGRSYTPHRLCTPVVWGTVHRRHRQVQGVFSRCIIEHLARESMSPTRAAITASTVKGPHKGGCQAQCALGRSHHASPDIHDCNHMACPFEIDLMIPLYIRRRKRAFSVCLLIICASEITSPLVFDSLCIIK